jgi:hypothetical protein
MKSALPLVLELAEPKMIAGDVDIQLSGGHRSTNSGSKSLQNGLINVDDVTVDVDDLL